MIRKLMERWPIDTMLRIACITGLIALALMMVGLALGTPLPVMTAMAVAPIFGTLSCLILGISIGVEVWRGRRREP